MPVPKRRHSKGKVRRKRNEKMQEAVVQSIVCSKCGSKKLPHRVCKECGNRK